MKEKESGHHVTPYMQPGDTLHYQLPALKEGEHVWTRVAAEGEPALPAEAMLYYTADYDSGVPFPVECFAPSGQRDDLYVWLTSAHFKRFDLTEAAQTKSKSYHYPPEENLWFAGKVTEMNGKPLKGGTLVAYHTTTNAVYDVPIEPDGQFRIAVDDYTEGETFFLQAQSAKGKIDFYQYQMNNDTIPPVMNTSRYRLPDRQRQLSVTTYGHVQELTGTDGERHFRMPGIEVKARLRKEEPPQTTNQFYMTSYIDQQEIEKRNYQTLYDILKSMPGIIVHSGMSGTGDKGSALISTRGSSTLNGHNTLAVLLDGMRFDYDDPHTTTSGSSQQGGGTADITMTMLDNLLYMPASEIESVELLKPWQTLAYVGGAIHGCISIRTRNASRREEVKSKGTYLLYPDRSVALLVFVRIGHALGGPTDR